MILGLAPYAPYYHHFKAAPVCLQYVITSCPHILALSHLRPRLHAPEPPALLEVVEEVHQPELNQQISDLLTARVLGLDDVGIEVS